MATLDKTGGNSEFPWLGRESHFVVQNSINLGPETINGVAQAAVAQGDIVQALSIPKGAVVLEVITEVEVDPGLVSAVEVGDGADPNGWDAAININAAAGTRFRSASVDAFMPDGKDYSTADTIDLTFTTVTGGPYTTGKVRVMARCVDMSIRK